MIARHVGEFGWVCPGDGPDHPAHASRDLTLDHIVEMQAGGAAFPSDDQLRVLCRSRNSANGARLANAIRAGHYVPSASRHQAVTVFDDARAQIRAKYVGGPRG